MTRAPKRKPRTFNVWALFSRSGILVSVQTSKTEREAEVDADIQYGETIEPATLTLPGKGKPT